MNPMDLKSYRIFPKKEEKNFECEDKHAKSLKIRALLQLSTNSTNSNSS